MDSLPLQSANRYTCTHTGLLNAKTIQNPITVISTDTRRSQLHWWIPFWYS